MSALMHVLCIDDEKDILNITKFALENLGQLKVTICNSGKDAIGRVEDIRPDIILLDVMMPEMAGVATLQALQKMEALKRVPVIFMTAKVQASEVDSYIALGAIGVIAKPFDPITLADTVKAYWQKSCES